EEVLPDGVVPDVRARIGRHGPKDDRRRVERSERVAVRRVDRVVDHDMDASPRPVSDEVHDLTADRLDSLRERQAPREILGWEMKYEVRGLDGVPVEPGPGRGPLRAQRHGGEEEQGGKPAGS